MNEWDGWCIVYRSLGGGRGRWEEKGKMEGKGVVYVGERGER